MRYEVVAGKSQQIPAIGSEGYGEFQSGEVIFYPDDDDQLPCSREDFGGYRLSPEQLEEIS